MKTKSKQAIIVFLSSVLLFLLKMPAGYACYSNHKSLATAHHETVGKPETLPQEYRQAVLCETSQSSTAEAQRSKPLTSARLTARVFSISGTLLFPEPTMGGSLNPEGAISFLRQLLFPHHFFD